MIPSNMHLAKANKQNTVNLIKTDTDAVIRKGSKESAGYDLMSLETVMLAPHHRHLFDIGLRLEEPTHECIYIRIASRSSLALKGVDAACLTENAQLSRCDCPASCSCLQPAVRLHRGRLLLRVPRSAHVMLVNMGSASTGNIVLILSHLPVREPPYFLTNARWRQSHPLIFFRLTASLWARMPPHSFTD